MESSGPKTGSEGEPGSISSAAKALVEERGHEVRLRRVFDKSLVPMLLLDNERRPVEANRAARLVFRLSLDEFRRRTVDDLTPPRDLATLKDGWSRLMRDGHVADTYEALFHDASSLLVQFCAVTNVLPGLHLVVFAPADWPEDELGRTEMEGEAPEPSPLSPREREVLIHVAAGADIASIAGELTISPATVRTHIRNANSKLGARNRPHAIAVAMQHGLIDLPPPHPGESASPRAG